MRLNNLHAILEAFDRMTPKTRRAALALLRGQEAEKQPPEALREIHMAFLPRVVLAAKNGEEDRIIAYELALLATQIEAAVVGILPDFE